MPSDRPIITQARLKELLHYDPETGHFTWLVDRNQRVLCGHRAGAVVAHGYIGIGVDRRAYRAHRLAFLYMEGKFPDAEVDHINRVKYDNRWGNLRAADRLDNMANTGIQSNNTSGHRGVHWFARRRQWQVYGNRGGRRHHLGYFNELADAVLAAENWRRKNHGEFACIPNPETLSPTPSPNPESGTRTARYTQRVYCAR